MVISIPPMALRLMIALSLICSLIFTSTTSAFFSAEKNEKALPLDGSSVSDTPDLKDIDNSNSEMRPWIDRYVADQTSLSRIYPIEISPTRQARFKQFYSDWLALLNKLNFDSMSLDGKVDYVLFKTRLAHELQQLEIQKKSLDEIAQLVPFAQAITDLFEARRRMEKIDSPKLAATLNAMSKQIETTRRTVEANLRSDATRPKKTAANRAAATIGNLRNTLRGWFNYYNGYDPLFTWWMAEPYKAVDQSLTNYATLLTERVVGLRSAPPQGATLAEGRGGAGGGAIGGGGRGNQGDAPIGGRGNQNAVPAGARAGDASDIIGDPIGRDALMVELAAEMIPYTPEELIAIGWKELDWCESEMKKASREMGFGEDWHKALEAVKDKYVEPGKQPEMIRDLAYEAIDYVQKNDLLTVPPLSSEDWWMEMMSPEQQLVSPFFLGGQTIQVSYPTNTMAHEQKMMSMRGNNPHFSRATVHHELIPGHHLQQFMTTRYKPYRRLFSTPFWNEGNSLYWELLLWDRGFAKTPEDKMGMLFWRAHRCARIVFSLSFQMEKMTPQQCIDLLVNRVGHEVDNATAEVRRSFAGGYGPLYQAGYLLGGLQFFSLHKELVDSGKMTNRAFHDAILREGTMPVEMVRATLTKQKLTPDFKTGWKFYGPNPAGQ